MRKRNMDSCKREVQIKEKIEMVVSEIGSKVKPSSHELVNHNINSK